MTARQLVLLLATCLPLGLGSAGAARAATASGPSDRAIPAVPVPGHELPPPRRASPPPPAPPVPAGGPRADFAEEIHDAGAVEAGTDVVHAFVVRNAGDGPLELDARPGCGCTVAEFDKELAPGAAGRVLATLRTADFKGPVAKTIEVATNDPSRPRITLEIRATVTTPLDVEPGQVLTFNGRASHLSPKRAVLSSADGLPFDIVGVAPSDAYFRVEVAAVAEGGATAAAARPGTVASGARRYAVTLIPSKDIPVGRLTSSVVVRTSHPRAQEIVLRAFGTVTGDVEVLPPSVTLSTGANAPDAARAQHVKVVKASGAPFHVVSVTSSDPSVATALVTVRDGYEYDLEIRYLGPPPRVALAALVTLMTTEPRQPTLEVQVWGRVDRGMRPPLYPPGATPPAPAPAAPNGAGSPAGGRSEAP